MSKLNKLHPVQILALFFIVVIFLGAVLLSFQISSSLGESTNYLDALFTSTSAASVTGLVYILVYLLQYLHSVMQDLIYLEIMLVLLHILAILMF